MAFSATYGAYNVQAAFNQWFVNYITSNGIPSWMPSARVVFDWGKERPLISGYSGHAFSLNHLNDIEVMMTQGKRVDNGTAGTFKAGQVEIGCWVDKQYAGNQLTPRLRTMRDMCSRIFQQHNSILLTNIYASTGNAASVPALVRLDGIEFQPPQADGINPDIWRVRGVLGLSWVERDG